ncbi:conserved hypothetical protein [Histoplasma capsulatum H143]|uniref:Uncharacterized protein n=1 Tax=Ajellomyces capsulatus (strain H143) TaxID=544712 RepID=C6HDW7_AJECH|nr:conserved hypothetical protein [Histoplasma capsulatum H143]
MVVSINYTVLAIVGLIFWCGIRGIPSQRSLIYEVAIHTLLVIITAGFAAGGLFHNWPLWIESSYGILRLYGLVKVQLKMDKDLTSDRQLRKRASTQAMRENTKPNKRTDRSQDRDDQTTAHVLLNEIRGKRQIKEGYVPNNIRQRLRLYCCGCEKDISGGGKCQLCGHACTSCPVCLHERSKERSVNRSPKPNQTNTHHDAETNLNQTSTVPAIHLSQGIDIDVNPETATESALYMLPYSSLKRRLERGGQQKRETWVNRTIKCCYCEGTGSAVNRCVCGHEYCGICFHYSDEPDATGEPVGEEVRD